MGSQIIGIMLAASGLIIFLGGLAGAVVVTLKAGGISDQSLLLAGLVAMVIGAFYAITGFGILWSKNWTGMLGILAGITALAATAVEIVHDSTTRPDGLLGAIWSPTMIWYLFRPHGIVFGMLIIYYITSA